MYVRVQKALCGCLKSALIIYKKLISYLESDGFEINPYNPCVANNTVEGKQLAITWHVGDIKILHVDKKFVSKTILWLEYVFGKMHVTCGN